MQVWLAEWEINARVPKLLEKYAFRMTVEELKKADPTETDSPHAAHSEEWKQRFVSEYERLKACGWRSERDFFIPHVPNRLLALLEEFDDGDKSAQSGAANNAAEIFLATVTNSQRWKLRYETWFGSIATNSARGRGRKEQYSTW